MKELKQAAEKESFATRWSRRKQGLQQQDTTDERQDSAAGELVETDTAQQRRDSLELIRTEKLAKLNALKDEDMPDIALLQDDSDFSQFMSTNVSEALRKLALHKLFHGKAYNIRDGLDEYDGDYTSFEKLDPGTITADMKYRLELEAEKLKAQLEMEQIDKAKELEALSDDEEPASQAELNDPSQPGLIETEGDADSDHETQAPGEQAKLQLDGEQADMEPSENEQASSQISRTLNEEK